MESAQLKAETWLQPGRFALFLATLVLIQFPQIIFGSESFFFRDYGFFGYPLAAYHRDSFWSAEIPLWNPYNNAGVPFLAQWNTMVFYPVSLIYLLLPMPWSLNIFCLFHQFLAGLGMYFLARRSANSNLAGAIAGLAFAFSGLLLSSLKWPNNIAAFGLMPWVVLLAWQQRSIALAALVGGAQMLAGAPEVIFLTWVIAGVMTAGEALAQKKFTPLFRLAAIVFLVAGLAAAQLLPFLDLLSQSQRSASFSASTWAMPITGWANFFIPIFRTFTSYHGVPAQLDQYWTSTYYVPLAALALAALALSRGWRPRLLAALALFGALMALGDPGYIYKIFRKTFPFLGFMRFPIKFVVLPVFLIPWIGSWGLAVAREKKNSLTTVAFLCALICAGLTFVPSPFERSQPRYYIEQSAELRILFLTIFAIGVLAKEKWRLPATGALLLAVWSDGRFHSPQQNPTAPSRIYDSSFRSITNAPTLGLGRAMLDTKANARLDYLVHLTPVADLTSSRLSLYCNANLIDRIPKVDGFYSLYLRESAQFIDLMYERTNQAYPSLEKLLAVSHRDFPAKPAEWVQSSEKQPWVTAGQRPVFASVGDTVREILNPNFDPNRVVYLPLTNQLHSKAGPAVVAITNLIWKPHHISFEANADGPARVVLSQSFHRNWRAKVGEAPVPIDRANHGFQSLEIPSGASRIELTYVDRKSQMGVVISICSLLIVFAMLVIQKRNDAKSDL